MSKPDSKQKPVEACYWIIGAKRAPAQTPAVAIDLHDKDGAVIGETHTIRMRPHDRGIAARKLARAYARKHGIMAANVSYDRDSSQYFENC